VSDNIAAELRKNHKVDEYFYPDISMDVDLPQGFKGEINSVMRVLEKNGFAANGENVFQIMNLKRNLLKDYGEKSERKKIVAEYSETLRKKEPVGSIVPLDYLLVGGIVIVVLFTLKRFLGSFADESGKLLARKLFAKSGTRKQLLKELNVSVDEYKIINNEIVVIITDYGESLDALRKRLQKAKKT
jgi:hypothetical protein